MNRNDASHPKSFLNILIDNYFIRSFIIDCDILYQRTYGTLNIYYKFEYKKQVKNDRIRELPTHPKYINFAANIFRSYQMFII
jgi:hypothetical protein